MSKIEDLSIDDIYYVADKYFANRNIMYNHNYASYEQFIEEYIKTLLYSDKNIFNTSFDDTYKYVNRFKFSNYKIALPYSDKDNSLIYPSMCRLRMLTYSLDVYADIEQIQDKYYLNTNQLISSKIISPKKDSKGVNTDHIIKNQLLASIPIMVKSKFCNLIANPSDRENKLECEFDPGCYFIIKGLEKIIVPQETQANNKLRCLDDMDSSYVQIISESPDVSINSQSVRISYYKKNKGLAKKGEINIEIPMFFEFPLIALFRVLGLKTDKEIVDSICYDKNNSEIKNILINAIRLAEDDEGNKINNEETAVKCIISKLRRQPHIKYSSDPAKRREQEKVYIKTILKDYLPHITHGGIDSKIKFTSYMVNKLLRSITKQIPYSMRDSFTQKRILLVGDLLFEIFKASFKSMLDNINILFNKKTKKPNEPEYVANIITDSTISKNIQSAITNGTFNKKTGVTNAVERLTYPFLLSLLRRIVAPLSKAVSSATAGPKKLQYSHFGFLCPNETPESEKVGLVKQLTIIGSITINRKDQLPIIEQLLEENCNIIKMNEIGTDYYKLNDFTKIIMEGELFCIIEDAEKVYKYLKECKSNGTIEKTVSIAYDDIENEIVIWCGSGRLIRPVLKVENHKLNLTKKMIEDDKKLEIDDKTTFDEFMYKNKNIIEFIDPEEQVYAMISPTPHDVVEEYKKIQEINEKVKSGEYKFEIANRYNNQIYKNYDYSEIHPSLLLGTIMSTSQFCNHADGTRSNLHYNQSKQSIGIYSSNYRHRFDKAFVLHHPAEPIVQTRASKYTNYNILSPGENVIMAIMCYTGFNQEDAIVINYDAIKRGLLKITNYNIYTSKLEKNQETGEDDKFMKPNENTAIYVNADFSKLNNKGFVPPETKIDYYTAIIGKVSSIKNNQYKDQSTIYKEHESAYIDKVESDIKETEDGYASMKVKTRTEYEPHIGDKFSTKSAQKATVGLILRAEDMPITKNGIIPDIIVNPNSIYGRKTMSYLLESLYSKYGALYGYNVDGTPFMDMDNKSLFEAIKKLGYNEYGLEEMYNGMTGEKIQSLIYIGPLYYLRLKHIVCEKIYAHPSGLKTTLTRQPYAGRRNNGGARISTMEQEQIISNGAEKFLKEKFVDTSDKYNMKICNNCGYIASRVSTTTSNSIYNSNYDIYECKHCGNITEFSNIEIPYASKLLIQELMAGSIETTLKTDDDQYIEEGSEETELDKND